MSPELRQRCELTMANFRAVAITGDEALREIFRLMALPGAAQVRASEFQAYVDVIMASSEKAGDAELDAAVVKTWGSHG